MCLESSLVLRVEQQIKSNGTDDDVCGNIE